MKSTIAKSVLTVIGSLLPVIPVSAVEDVCNSGAPDEVKDAAGCNGSSDQLPNVVVNILNAIIIVAGIVSVIWIVIGGVGYMTSSGDANKTKKAKDTILYSVIGLTICVLAFAIVNFVINDILAPSV